jgi:hypothetical protein
MNSARVSCSSALDQSTCPFGKTACIGTRVRDRTAANAEHIRVTLQRLKQRAEAS